MHYAKFTSSRELVYFMKPEDIREHVHPRSARTSIALQREGYTKG